MNVQALAVRPLQETCSTVGVLYKTQRKRKTEINENMRRTEMK
jgi:hypothetical protein